MDEKEKIKELELSKIRRKKRIYRTLFLIQMILMIACFIMIGFQNTGTIDLSEQLARAYNAEFDWCLGDDVSGADVKALVRDVVFHNRENQEDPSLQIEIIKDSSTPNTKVQSKIIDLKENEEGSPYYIGSYKSEKTYKVVGGYDPKTGYLVSIAIKRNQ